METNHGDYVIDYVRLLTGLLPSTVTCCVTNVRISLTTAHLIMIM